MQFGRPIGSFQAIKHKCADMLLEVESAKSAAYYAAWCAAEDNDELPVTASLAKAYCSDAYFHAAAENIQIHGGIGFTWEHDAHLYFKRAKSDGVVPRRPDVSPRAARAAHRDLSAPNRRTRSAILGAMAAFAFMTGSAEAAPDDIAPPPSSTTTQKPIDDADHGQRHHDHGQADRQPDLGPCHHRHHDVDHRLE